MAADVLDTLAAFPLFQAVPRPQLAWLLANATPLEMAAGEQLYAVGDPVEHTHIVLQGELRIFDPAHLGHGFVHFEAGMASGYLPFSRMTTAQAIVQTTRPSTILALPKALTQEMAAQHFELTQALVGVMTTRVRDTTAQHQQNDRLVALGKLSAGLAHELNNPIGAVASTVDYLGRHAKALTELTVELLNSHAEAAALADALALFAPAPALPALSLMAKGSLEDDLHDWLDEHQVPDAPELADALAELGRDPAALDGLARRVPAGQLALLLRWAHHGQQLGRLAADACEATSRVTEIIKSVKTYTHMDQSPALQATDLHEGLRTTLTLMAHKFRQNQVQLELDFDRMLPLVQVIVGEMNQVWTNLLDNALDALHGQPGAVLCVRTSHDRDFAQVTITDNGPGIPPAVQAKIFDPFFTTKAPGQGTGLGLDMVQRVVRQHQGAINVTSEPGRTSFEVSLPLHS